MSLKSQKIRRWAATAAASLVLGAHTMAWAATPEEVVADRTEAVASVLAQPDSPDRADALGEAIDESLDFAFLAGLALGDHWTERTDEERQEFMDLLRTLLQTNYEDRLAGHELDEDYRVHYEEARTRGDRAFVNARVAYDGREERVVYRLYRGEDGWRIYDLIVDDISLEETYRDGYVPIIEEHGWSDLIRRMQERVDQLTED